MAMNDFADTIMQLAGEIVEWAMPLMRNPEESEQFMAKLEAMRPEWDAQIRDRTGVTTPDDVETMRTTCELIAIEAVAYKAKELSDRNAMAKAMLN